ncbi:MAG: TetR/AcrR family transcriptional regulator [Alphaproteobacteria bacterium]|nr:TetR/AcrR family transcriptional regulator [Alphaproteobacteria bacterium]MBF0251598.1 TetR/AcrR family transcriptional regulator [Alphaproteobacteria bacterium]
MPTDDDILDVATRAFAEKGFDGARIDDIAHRAGVNKATLYYRIGGKDALYARAMERILGPKIARAERALVEIPDVEARLRLLARLLVDGADHEHASRFAAIMLREIAAGASTLPDTALALMGRFLAAIERTVAEGVAQGIFRPINPFLAHMALVGSGMLYAVNEPVRRRIADIAPGQSKDHMFLSPEDAARQVADMLLNGIRKP